MASEDAIYETLNEIFCDVFQRQDIRLEPALTAGDVDGWDSFKQIEIIVACEQRFGIRFSTRELDMLSCVGDLAQCISRKTNTGSPSS